MAPIDVLFIHSNFPAQFRNLAEHLAADDLGLGGQAPALIVGQENPPAAPVLVQLLLQHPVLFHDICDHIPLFPVDPAGDRRHHQLPCLDDHAAILPPRRAEFSLDRSSVTPYHRTELGAG